MTTPPRIAIIGGGFSGTLAAVHLVRAETGAPITLIERTPTVGPGLAYATTCDAHLLNVPAARMSAFPDAPAHFQDWAADTLARPVAPAEFLPRALYGRYIRDILREATERHPGAFRTITASATGLRTDPRTNTVTITLDAGAPITADHAILALGHLPPSDPPVAHGPHFSACPVYARNPWDAGAAANLDPRAPVVLIGTGLTMIDVALSLGASGHTGPITAVSRRGLLPRWHTNPPRPPHATPPIAPGATPRQALRAVRAAAPGDWRPTIDALRPVTSSIWMSWTSAHRVSFLRHIRPHWDVHRHRAAPSIGERVDRLIATGCLRIVAGRTLGWTPTLSGVSIAILPRGATAPISIEAARVINCTGPTQSIARTTDPLVRAMVTEGTLTPDPLAIGARCDADGRVLDRSGRPHPSLWMLGPWRSAQVWESVAVPELRVQCAGVAAAILATVRDGAGITLRPV